ncbi:MAG: 30S ribosomal protein S11 [Planctomycetota bacterium]
MPEESKEVRKRKKVRKVVPSGIVHIKATFNNTILSLTDLKGETLCWATCGSVGYSGTKKGTAYAAQKAAESLLQKAQKFGLKEVIVRVKGPGPGREAAIRTLQSKGLRIKQIEDVTPLPHNGCRAPKRRRV